MSTPSNETADIDQVPDPDLMAGQEPSQEPEEESNIDRPGAPVSFTVTHDFDEPPERLWAAMVDWEAHGEWIPATVVEVGPGDPTVVGATFTGLTGYGPVMLVDPMVIDEISWDPATGHGRCVVNKLGPQLRGRAGFDLGPTDSGSRIVWFEDVTVRYLPRLLAPVVNRLSAVGFSLGMRKLAKLLSTEPSRYT